MTTLILDNSPEEIAKALDDKSLDKMIKSIAQTLCCAHYEYHSEVEMFSFHIIKNGEDVPQTPLNIRKDIMLKLLPWSQWARECVANYKWLNKLGQSLLMQWVYRHPDTRIPVRDFILKYKNKNFQHKLQSVIYWLNDNVPELPDHPYGSHLNNEVTDFPLVIPEKFKIVLDTSTVIPHYDIIESYRNYYNHLLSKYKADPVWTRREKPEWIKL